MGVRQVPERAAQSQAQWAAGTGYVPIASRRTDSPRFRPLWAEIPGYKVAYDQLLTGVEQRRDGGSGDRADYQGVRDAVRDVPSSRCSPRGEPEGGAERRRSPTGETAHVAGVQQPRVGG